MPKRIKENLSLKKMFEGSMNNGKLRVTKPDHFYNQEPVKEHGFKSGDSVGEVVEVFLTNLQTLEIMVQQGRMDPSEAFQRAIKLSEVLDEIRQEGI